MASGARVDAAYLQCVFQEEDAEDHRGINLNKDLPDGHRGGALKANITAIGPLVLPT